MGSAVPISIESIGFVRAIGLSSIVELSVELNANFLGYEKKGRMIEHFDCGNMCHIVFSLARG